MNICVIMWEITLDCNLNCSFCLAWERRKSKYWKITFLQAKKIINNLPKNSHISFIWWESFLFPRFFDILNFLDEKWITYEITTNGTTIDINYKKINALKNLTNIYFSIDFFWEKHDNIRGYRWLFEKIINTIPKIKKKVYINTIILDELSFDELLELYKFFLRLKVNHLRLAYYTNFSINDVNSSIKTIPQLNIKMRFLKGINNKKLRKNSVLFFKKLKLLNDQVNSWMTVDFNPISILRWFPIACKSLDKYFRINENWKLTICHFIDNEFDSLIDTSFDIAIKNKKYLELKDKIKLNFPLNICNTCWKWI